MGNQILVKNIFQITKSCYLDKKLWIFKADEERQVPDTFLNPDFVIKFAFLKLTGFVREDGSILGPGHKSLYNKSANDFNYNQKYVYCIKNLETDEKMVSCSIRDICRKLEVMDKSYIRVYLKEGKDIIKGWRVLRFLVDEFKEMNPEWFENDKIDINSMYIPGFEAPAPIKIPKAPKEFKEREKNKAKEKAIVNLEDEEDAS